MSTRSMIGKMENGTVRAVYCHFDGYVEDNGVGGVLYRHYQDESKIDALLDGGSVRSLGADVDDGSTEFYNRIRGEKTKASYCKSLDKFLNMCCEYSACFIYLFVDGEWLVAETDKRHRYGISDFKDFVPLADCFGAVA